MIQRLIKKVSDNEKMKKSEKKMKKSEEK